MPNRTAIVTGSESGIGRATAAALARAGCDVGITWLEEEGMARETAALVEAEGRRAVIHQIDVADVPAAQATIDAMAAELGRLDVFVSNAGIGGRASALEVTEEHFRRLLDVNVIGAFFASQAAARRMVSQGEGGRIVNVTSVQEHAPAHNAAAYGATKHGLGALTKALAVELAPHGITVNSVAPGPVVTRGWGAPEGEHGPRPHHGPFGRTAHPDEIAAVIAFVCSPQASYVSGASLVADGGLLADALKPEQPPPRPTLGARIRRRMR